MRRSRRGLFLASAALVAAATLMLAGVGAQARADSTHMVPAVLAGLPLATLDGAAPANQMIGIGVSLARPDTTGEIALYNELYNPSSREYQQFLTPAQFDQQFGVPSAQSSAVESWLEAGGLSIETTSPAGDYFTAAGDGRPARQPVRRRDRRATRYDGQQLLANNVPPSVPDDLPIDAVVGLDNVRQFSLGSLTSTHARDRARHASGRSRAPKACSPRRTCGASTTTRAPRR